MLKELYQKIPKKLSPLDARTKAFEKTLADNAYREGKISGYAIGYAIGYENGRQSMAAYMAKEA